MKGHGWEVDPTLPKREGSPNTTLTCAAQASSFVVFYFPSPPPSPLLGWDVLSPGPTPRKHSLSRSLSPTNTTNLPCLFCFSRAVPHRPSLSPPLRTLAAKNIFASWWAHDPPTNISRLRFHQAFNKYCKNDG